MRYLILIAVLVFVNIDNFGQQSIICNSRNTDSIDTVVDSLFKSHLNSMKSNFGNEAVTLKRSVSVEDVLFLDMFYNLSGLLIGDHEYTYGRHPVYLTKKDIEQIEEWYNLHKIRLKSENIKRIYYLIGKKKLVDTNNLDQMEMEYNKIEQELDELIIE